MKNSIIRTLVIAVVALALAIVLAVGSSLLAQCGTQQEDSGVSASEISD